MKMYAEGDQARAVCHKCKAVCAATFRYKPYVTEFGDSVAEVLQGFCNACGERILLPPQSTPRVAPYYQKQSVVEEFRIPNPAEDALLCLGSEFGMEKPDVFKALLRFYLDKKHVKLAAKAAVPDLGKAKARLSVRIEESLVRLFAKRIQDLDMPKSQFVVAMIWDAKDRLLGKTQEAKAFLEATKLMRRSEEETKLT